MVCLTGIVITSLDSESDGEEERPTTTDRAYDGDSEDEHVKVTVPSGFLDRLRKRQALEMDLPALLRGPESDPSKALVLFRPLGVPNTSDEPSSSAVDRGYEVEEEREDPDTEQEDYMSGTPLDAASPIIPVEDGVEVEDITDNNADMDDAMDVEPL
ncbi:hypothetical protein K474DRAFT_1007302 [Panus rudis PR-1116 ss-1]|nr:hypothetical protein K474DRAFT_1007302 [Panus rudis PR-1116 ss-1]